MTRIWGGMAALAACAALGTAGAAGTDQLWEVSTQMNMPGLPAGMGAQKSQVCAEKGDLKKSAQGRGDSKCKTTDFKQSGNTVHMAMSCPEGDAVMDTTYNAAHTEYKGTMKMTSRRGDMTMNMQGRVIGTCDAKQAKAEREEKVAVAKQQIDQSKAQIAAVWDKEIASCNRVPETMQGARGLAQLGGCAPGGQGIYCGHPAVGDADPGHKRAVTACTAAREKYCARYAAADGFAKAKADPEGAQICNLDPKQLAGTHCSQALKTENFSYLLNDFCSEQKRTLARQHCAGRDYTSQIKDKYSDFCRGYLAHASIDEEPEASASKPASLTSDPKAAVQQGVTQGINKLKGLFGR